MVKAFFYLRVSGTAQIDGFGFDRQEESCRNYAKKAGISVAGVYREDCSGTKDETSRPIFQEMIAAILANGVHTIIVEGLDRLARELRIQETLLVYLASKNVDLVSARTAENVTEAIKADPLKKALIQIQGVFSELEKNQIVHRLRKGRERCKAERGRCEGRLPYGQTPAEKETIHRIKNMRRRHKGGHPGMTLKQIADILNQENISTRLGKRWTAGQIHVILNRK